MTIRAGTTLVAAASILLVGVAAFAGIYLTMFNPKRVAAVTLPTPSPVTQAGIASASPAAGGSTWKVTSGSFVGYRVREQLAILPAPSDAVGRTTAVTGGATVTINADGTATVSALTVSADLSQLQSDSARRDNFVSNNALDTSQYPDAQLTTSANFTVPASVVGGAAGQVTVSAKLTIHGVTKDVSIPVKLQRSGSSVNVVGSYQFQWGDFGVNKPQIPVASVQSDPTIEISLVLTSA